ncbi:hypothetical protein CC78DRAFT_534315 [Lojkania enalia]|uniref:Uncharacterized protein n=1 Tax=Lojkania enalia TaxID=147567 RepID=A0A9P4MYX2_9PLEO|nr:hypothetical protein CC78DRAFT_534315 [Didymosphaeria enalia]
MFIADELPYRFLQGVNVKDVPNQLSIYTEDMDREDIDSYLCSEGYMGATNSNRADKVPYEGLDEVEERV